MKIRMGIIGLGRGFMLTAPTIVHDSRIEAVAAVALDRAARLQFERDFQGVAFGTVAELCRVDDIDLIYVASPHDLHAEHAIACMDAKKHVLVEKPLATCIADCHRMIAAAKRNGVQLFVGPSHSYDPQILLTRQLIESKRFGELKSIVAIQFTDFVYRPRRPEEFDRLLGGGVVFGQAVHHFDVLQLIAGSTVKRIAGVVGDWDPERSMDGAYTAFLEMRNGVVCTINYSGYAHFNTDSLMEWNSETGGITDSSKFVHVDRRMNGEEGRKRARGLGPVTLDDALSQKRGTEHFGYVLVSCQRADLQPTSTGVEVHSGDGMEIIPLPQQQGPRSRVFDEVCAVLSGSSAPIHDGDWGLATIEACQALVQSSDENREIVL